MVILHCASPLFIIHSPNPNQQRPIEDMPCYKNLDRGSVDRKMSTLLRMRLEIMKRNSVSEEKMTALQEFFEMHEIMKVRKIRRVIQ